MTQEGGMRVFRQASDDAREMAMRVIHDQNQNLDSFKTSATETWRTIIEILRRITTTIKETVQAPDVLLDQLQIIFRDESKLKVVFIIESIFNTFF